MPRPEEVSIVRTERPIDLQPDDGSGVRRRSAKERVLRTAIELIALHGADRVTASEIISLAGVSRSTLYGYFGDVGGILAEIWAHEGPAWLDHLVSPPVAPTSLPASSLDLALLDLFAVASRIPELRELVLPDTAALLVPTAGRPADQVRRTWVLAATIGVALAAPVLPGAAQLGFLPGVFASIPGDAETRYDITARSRPIAPRAADPIPVSGETTADRIVRASIEVVGRSGYHSASMVRICRVARLTVGAAAPLFSSLTELHDRAFASMLRNVVDENALQFQQIADPGTGPHAGADAYAAFTQGMTQPSRATWRRYRHELFVAARTAPELAVKMRTAFAEASGEFAKALAASGVDPRRADLLILVNQVLSLGMAYAGELGFPVETIDHRIATRHFWAEVVEPRHT